MLSPRAEAPTATPDGRGAFEVSVEKWMWRCRAGSGGEPASWRCSGVVGRVYSPPNARGDEPSIWRMSGEMAERNERQTVDWFLQNAPIVKGQSNATVGSWHGDRSNQPLRCGALPAKTARPTGAANRSRI